MPELTRGRIGFGLSRKVAHYPIQLLVCRPELALANQPAYCRRRRIMGYVDCV